VIDRLRFRRFALGAALVAVATLAGCSSSVPDVSASPAYETSIVQRGDLFETVSFSGVLTYDGAFPVVYQASSSTDARGAAAASGSGIVTWVAPASTVLASGDVMYRVNNVPVVFLEGDAVLWRPLASGDTGSDVLAIESALAALGYNAAGSVIVDSSYYGTTREMVRDFEDAYGLDETTTFPFQSVVMRPADVIVTDVALAVGDAVGAGDTVMTVSDTSRVATFSVAPADRASITAGQAVTVRLPDGSSVAATIASISAGLDSTTGEYAATALLDEPVEGLGDKVDVTVKASIPLAADALLVPPAAIVKRDDGTTVVRAIRDGGLVYVPVTVRATTGQSTAVDSDDLAVGDNVAVT